MEERIKKPKKISERLQCYLRVPVLRKVEELKRREGFSSVAATGEWLIEHALERLDQGGKKCAP